LCQHLLLDPFLARCDGLLVFLSQDIGMGMIIYHYIIYISVSRERREFLGLHERGVGGTKVMPETFESFVENPGAFCEPCHHPSDPGPDAPPTIYRYETSSVANSYEFATDREGGEDDGFTTQKLVCLEHRVTAFQT